MDLKLPFNKKNKLTLCILAISIFALLDFLSKNMQIILPSIGIEHARIIPGQVVPNEITLFWNSVIFNNIFLGAFFLVIGVSIFGILIKNIELELIPFRRFDLLLPFIAFLIGVYLWRLPEGNLDYYRYYRAANAISTVGFIKYFEVWNPSGTDLPFISTIYGLIFSCVGVSRVAIQLFKTICFASTVFLTYSLGSIIWNRTVGLYASIILMTVVPYVLQVPTTLVDIPYVFFLILFAYSLVVTYRLVFWHVNALLTIILIPFVILSKASSVLYVPLIFIAVTGIFILQSKDRKNIFKRASIILISEVTFLIILMLTFHSKFLLLYERWTATENMNSYSQAILHLLLKAWIFRNPFGWFLNSIYLFGIIVIVTSFLAIIYLIKQRDFRGILIIAWAILPLFTLPGGQRFDWIRYLFPSIPAFAMAAALTISKLKTRIAHILLTSLLLSSLFTASFIQMPLINAGGMAAIQSSCELVNSLDVDSVGIVHVAETVWGKKLIAHKGQLMIHFNYQMRNNLRYYDPRDLIQSSDEIPEVLILVSDTYGIPYSLQFFLSNHYNLMSVKEGYLGGAWSPIICRIYTR